MMGASDKGSAIEPRWEAAKRALLEEPLKNANECAYLVSHLSSLVDEISTRTKQSPDDVDAANKASKSSDVELEDEKDARKRVVHIVHALQKYFEHLQTEESLRSSESAASRKFHKWTKEQIKSYQSCLRRCCASRATPAGLRAETIFAVLDSIKLEAGKRFNAESLDFVLRLVCCGDQLSGLLLEILTEEYFVFADVAYYGLKSLARLSEDVKSGKAEIPENDQNARENAVCNAFDLLCALTKTVGGFLNGGEASEMPLAERPCLSRRVAEAEEAGVGGAGANAATPIFLQEKAMRGRFTQAWLSFLRLDCLPGNVLRKSLTMLPDRVIPLMTTPILLSDILTNAVGHKGLVGILALHGLFVLVVSHDLEYPNFYRQLYNMLTAGTLLTKYRARFYRLVDTFLSTPLIPAYVVAAFVKRFARLALQAPPHGALLCMTFIFNLIRRHPSCSILLEGRGSGGTDPYDSLEADPAQARALDSSLWELETLRSHYHHEVQRFVQVFKRDMTRRNKYTEIDLEKFVERSYDETFVRENTKRLKLCGVRLPQKDRKTLF